MNLHRRSGQAAWIAALSVLWLIACGRPEPRTLPQGADGDQTIRSTDGPFGRARIRGVVRFVGPAPDNPLIDMHAVPLCRGIYHAVPRQRSVIVNRNGTLANVFIYVKRGLAPGSRYTAPSDTLLLTQRGCQYQPRLLGMMVGQVLDVRNDDAVAHRLEARGVKTQPFTVPLDAGRSSDHVFHSSEVMLPVECDEHRWMRAYVGILPHPFFATTGDDGRFTITDLPAGTYTLEAWHEAYGRRAATVTVDSSTQHVTFTYAATVSETSE